MKFLLVDDDERILLLLQTYLAPFAKTSTATNGKQAMEIFTTALKEHDPFHVIFMDINMPDMGGHEVVNELRILEREFANDHPPFKLVMISAYSETMDLHKTLYQKKATAYINKPFTKQSLLAELGKVGIISG